MASTCPACSTPFGISDFGTLESIRDNPADPGAQRLSASLTSAHSRTSRHCSPRTVLNAFLHLLRRHPRAPPVHTHYQTCSTPLCISDFGTLRDLQQGEPEHGVLNAFRHL